MKKYVLVASLLTCHTILFAAQNNNPGRFGLGLILGDPTGISAKYWLSKTRAWDATIGFGDVSVHADYLWHRWDILPKPQKGWLAAYWGLGIKVQDKKKGILLGIRGVAGIAYDFPRHPLEVFLEVVPVLELSPDAGLGLDAGLGIRYYFK